MRSGVGIFYLAVPLCLVSCVTTQPQFPSSQVITVTGSADSHELAALEDKLSQLPKGGAGGVSGVDPAWARRRLDAEGHGRPPSSYSSEETRRLMAKREAVGQAWRELALQLERLEIPGHQQVGVYWRNDDKIRRKIEDLICHAEIAQERENPDGSYQVLLSLQADDLASFLPPNGRAARNSGSSPGGRRQQAERDQLRDLTRQNAEKDARRRLLDRIKTSPIGPDLSMADAMREDPRLNARVERLAQGAAIRETRFPKPGRCEVDIQFDLAEARRLAIGQDERPTLDLGSLFSRN